MRILVLNPILYTANNGVIPANNTIKDTMIYTMCLGYKQLGHEVTLCAALDYKPAESEDYDFEVLFFKSDFTKLFPPSVLPYSKDLKHFLKAKSPYYDMIVSSEVFSFQSLWANRYASAKTIIWHELALHQHKFFQIPSKFWYNVVAKIFMQKSFVVARSVDAIKFISKYMRRVSPEFVEHGVDLNKFPCSEHKKQQFIVVAQLIKRKNISSIIEKFDRFLQKYDRNYCLLIVGRGEEEENLKQQVLSLNLGEKVQFLGFLSHEELKSVLSESSAMLIDTLQDNNMVSIPESVVCGTPILTNEVPTNASFVKKKALGIVKDWNEDDMCEISHNSDYIENCIKIRRQLSNVAQAEKMIQLFNEDSDCK